MNRGRKQICSIVLAILLLVFSGCAQEAPEEEAFVREKEFDIPDRISLQVMVDENRPLEHIQAIAEQFTGIYGHITIEVVEMPSPGKQYGEIWEQKRQEMISSIEEERSTGGGPDIFLLQASASYEDRLFPDLNMAIRQGYFADLNQYYLMDDELYREGLISEVMEAGVVDGARYLLPLVYDYPVAYVDMDRLYAAGLDSSIFDSGVISLLNAVCRLGDSQVADAASRAVLPGMLPAYFPNMLDYDTGEVLITSGELTEFLELVQEYRALGTGESPSFGMISSYCRGTDWWQQGYCMNLGWLYTATQQTAIAKAQGFDLRMFPLTGADGKLTAEVDWVGAVNANCEYPEVAYEFLRMLLLPEAMTDIAVWNAHPVRTHGYVSAVYQNAYESALHDTNIIRGQEKDDEAIKQEERLEALDGVEVMDSDLPVLLNTIETVQMVPCELKDELSSMVAQLNDPETGQPIDVDIEALAEEYIDFLHAYLHGGTETE